jgi:hypothetical protein
MAQARDHRIEVGELRLVRRAMAEIGRDRRSEAIGTAHEGFGQRTECLVAPFRRQPPLLHPGAFLSIETCLQAVSGRIGNGIVQGSRAPLCPGMIWRSEHHSQHGINRNGLTERARWQG